MRRVSALPQPTPSPTKLAAWPALSQATPLPTMPPRLAKPSQRRRGLRPPHVPAERSYPLQVKGQKAIKADAEAAIPTPVSTPAHPKMQFLLDLVGQGPEAIAAALQRRVIQVRLPGKKTMRTAVNADPARVSSSLLEKVPGPMRVAMLEDRKA